MLLHPINGMLILKSTTYTDKYFQHDPSKERASVCAIPKGQHDIGAGISPLSSNHPGILSEL